MSTFYAALDGVNPQPEHDPLQGGGPQGEAKSKKWFSHKKNKFYSFFLFKRSSSTLTTTNGWRT